MKKIDMQMKYWANMLNEAVSDNTLNERRMAGPAAVAKGGIDEIAQMRQQLNDGIVEFEFVKADGTLRHAVGTTSDIIVPVAERRKLDPNYDENLASYMRRQNFIIWFWDLEKNEARCFNTNRFERTIKAEPFNRLLAGNVEKVGDIFIHRDIDQAVQLNQDRIDDIKHALEDEFGGFNGQAHWDDAVPGADVIDIRGFEIGMDQHRHTPYLRIEFTKRGNDNDPPYQLCVNEIRKYIKQAYGVDIKRVEVVGAIEY